MTTRLHPRPTPLLAAAILSMLLTGAAPAAAQTSDDVQRQRRVPVPSLAGRDVGQARALLAPDLELGRVVERISGKANDGRIFDQAPAGGTMVLPGTAVNVVVARWVEVPPLRGLDLVAARALLGRSRLRPGRVRRQISGEADEGRIFDQKPPPRKRVPPGTEVSFTVAQWLRVPDVAGVDADEARRILAEAGLGLGRVTLRPSPRRVGEILSQAPATETPARPGTRVDVVVAQWLEVPSLSGLLPSEAAQRLERSGLTLGLVGQRRSAEPEGRIVDHLPTAGTRVRPGTAVDVMVAEWVEVPSLVGLEEAGAGRLLEPSGLSLRASRELSAAQLEGRIFDQKPVAGMRVRPDSAVDVRVALWAEVPPLIGLQADDGEGRLRRSRLRLRATEELSAAQPEGRIFDQEPAPGTRVRPDSTVDARVAQWVEVPSLEGLEPAAARQRLAGARLGLGDVTRKISAAQPEDRIFEQEPEAGTRVPPDSAVDAVQAEWVEVPSLLRLEPAAAARRLAASRLALGATTRRLAPEPEGEIIDQDPGAGTRVPPGDEVTVVVALWVEAPDLVGRQLSAARAALEAGRLLLGDSARRLSPLPEGEVLSQGTPAGTRVPPRSAIDVVVSGWVIVPALVGHDLESAREILVREQLELGEHTTEISPRPRGEILDQEPAAETRIAPGRRVGVVVAEWPLVPDLVGRDASDVAELLGAARLVPGTTGEEPSREPAGGVLSQVPAAGTRRPLDSPVDVVVARAPRWTDRLWWEDLPAAAMGSPLPPIAGGVAGVLLLLAGLWSRHASRRPKAGTAGTSPDVRVRLREGEMRVEPSSPIRISLQMSLRPVASPGVQNFVGHEPSILGVEKS